MARLGIDAKLDDLFEDFARECPRDYIEPYDWYKFCDFIVRVHERGAFSMLPLITYELQQRGFDSRLVQELSDRLDRGITLLDAYTRAQLDAAPAVSA